MIEMGIVVGLGLLVMFIKLGWRGRLWLLSHPLLVDIIVFALLNMLHWGTFSGVMVAAVGALFCSLVLSVGRWLFGHRDHGHYIPGVFNLEDKLHAKL